MRRFTLLLLLSLFALQAFASKELENRRKVFLRSATLDTSELPHAGVKFARSLESEESLLQWIVHLKAPNTPEQRAEVEKTIETKLGSYVPQNSYITVAGKDIVEKAKKSKNVLWVGPYLPEYKLSPSLKNLLPYDQERVKVVVESTFAKNCPQVVEKFGAHLKQMAIPHSFENPHLCEHLTIKTEKIMEAAEALAKLAESHWIEPVARFTAQNSRATGIVQTGSVGVKLPITGQGQTVAIGDTGVNTGSCFLSGNKVTNCASGCTDPSGHGTAVAAVVAGKTADATNSAFNGHASDASLYSIPLASSGGGQEGTTVTVPAMSGYLAKVKESAAPVSLSSFVGPDTSSYTADNNLVDAFAVDNPNVLLIFPAGNTGTNGLGGVGSPASSKNVLTVGSSQNDFSAIPSTPTRNITSSTFYAGKNVVSTFSSRGPTFDLRVKPDVVAPGEFISTASNTACGVSQVSGTSFAAAAAAGAAALVRDYFARGYYPSGNAGGAALTPSSALIKAVLINSGEKLLGVDIKGPSLTATNFIYLNAPDAYEGWGRIQLSSSLFFTATPSSRLIVSGANDAVNAGQTMRYCFTAIGNIKATLVWTDPAAASASAYSLVNNLDLSLVDTTSGRQYRTSASSWYDNTNNVEKVFAYFNTTVTLAAFVTGTSINVNDKQAFGLAISGNVNTVACPAAVTCPSLCSGKGTCDAATGTCTCNAGFSGPDCSISACPGNCNAGGTPTSRRGYCDLDTLKCVCIPKKYAGADCGTDYSELVNYVYEDGLPDGAFIGAIIGGILIGLVIGCVIGPFIALKFLEKERKKKREQLMRGQGDM
eukprot:TRINITY_DN517_c0_g2_i1.p1 TRINITY_DN517_c0_g2~~TRINITY_DN517_c0_g2_i1.p1  ORF type:complete len:822 (-),score=257.99 TRINITY_DN517_c0_g2_i1:225-2690(-)